MKELIIFSIYNNKLKSEVLELNIIQLNLILGNPELDLCQLNELYILKS